MDNLMKGEEGGKAHPLLTPAGLILLEAPSLNANANSFCRMLCLCCSTSEVVSIIAFLTAEQEDVCIFRSTF